MFHFQIQPQYLAFPFSPQILYIYMYIQVCSTRKVSLLLQLVLNIIKCLQDSMSSNYSTTRNMNIFNIYIYINRLADCRCMCLQTIQHGGTYAPTVDSVNKNNTILKINYSRKKTNI